MASAFRTRSWGSEDRHGPASTGWLPDPGSDPPSARCDSHDSLPKRCSRCLSSLNRDLAARNAANGAGRSAQHQPGGNQQHGHAEIDRIAGEAERTWSRDDWRAVGRTVVPARSSARPAAKMIGTPPTAMTKPAAKAKSTGSRQPGAARDSKYRRQHKGATAEDHGRPISFIGPFCASFMVAPSSAWHPEAIVASSSPWVSEPLVNNSSRMPDR